MSLGFCGFSCFRRDLGSWRRLKGTEPPRPKQKASAPDRGSAFATLVFAAMRRITGARAKGRLAFLGLTVPLDR
jgi:hypothetical protein